MLRIFPVLLALVFGTSAVYTPRDWGKGKPHENPSLGYGHGGGPGHGGSPGHGGYSSGSSGVAPSAQVKNGTYEGVYSDEYDQDYFLGVPFAQPPIGNLRFRLPQSLNSSWDGTHGAKEYSSECVGYGSDQWNYNTSEDCLYLNVVRPAGYANQQLPVAFWIHGGGYYQGGGVDQRYNLSFMIQNSVDIGKPIIGVSINYRLAAWGFLQSDQVQGSGNNNLGLRDQRLALHWLQENIAAFGGDPSKVTIWGESAGGSSVGFHLTAYGGRDDGLFRGAMMESGNPVFYGSLRGTDFYQPRYDNITLGVGCNNSTDTLQCLRDTPFEQLNNVINTTTLSGGWNPVVDGDFIRRYTSLELADGDFVHVPIISGANSDEGSAFSPQGINTTEDFYNHLIGTLSTSPAPLPPSLADQILEAYPDDPAVGVPVNLPPDFRPGPPQGAQYRRSAAYYGDAVFIANRRLTCQAWSAAGVPAYCYRFNAIPAGVPSIVGATHFQEVAFVFYNLMGVGYEPAATPPFENKTQNYADLAQLMDSSWVSFVHDQDPNSFRAGNATGDLWPRYSVDDPQDFVFDANVTSYAEPDTFRMEGMALINANNAGVYQR